MLIRCTEEHDQAYFEMYLKNQYVKLNYSSFGNVCLDVAVFYYIERNLRSSNTNTENSFTSSNMEYQLTNDDLQRSKVFCSQLALKFRTQYSYTGKQVIIVK